MQVTAPLCYLSCENRECVKHTTNIHSPALLLPRQQCLFILCPLLPPPCHLHPVVRECSPPLLSSPPALPLLSFPPPFLSAFSSPPLLTAVPSLARRCEKAR